MIGTGYFAGHQIEAWKRIEGVTIAAVADRDAERARAFAERHGIERWYTDAGAMLAETECDFVDIVTRPDAHAELVRLAAANGKAVLCQKPFSRSMEEAAGLVRLCREAGVRLMVNENWRWQPWYREMHRLLQAGSIGEVHHARVLVRPGDGSGDAPYPVQPYFRTMERFFVQESLVHFIDTLRFLMGRIERIYCRTRRLNPVIAGEDFALITLDFESGATAVIDANRYAGEKPSETFGVMAVEGSEGSLELGNDGSLTFIDLQGNRRAHDFPLPKTPYYRGDSCRATQAHFVECLRRGVPFETEGETYLETLAAVEGCYESARTGQSVLVRCGTPSESRGQRFSMNG